MRAAAEDAVVLLPEAAPALEQDLRRGVVVQLADGPLLRPREGLQDLHVPQHREWHGDDGIVARLLEAPRRGLVEDRHIVGRLVDGDHLRAEADILP